MTQTNQDEIAEVQAIVERVWQHFVDQEPEAMLELLHASCTVWDVFQPQLVDKATMTAYVDKDFKQSAARGKLTRSMGNYVIDVWGDTALVRFTGSYSYAPPNAISGKGRTTVVLRRFDEGWRFVHVHEGHLPEGIPPI